MGEQAKDRAGLLMALANPPRHPESVPINMLVKVKGTPWRTRRTWTRSNLSAPSPWHAS